MRPKHVCVPEDPPGEIVSSGEIILQRSQAEAEHAEHTDSAHKGHVMEHEGMKHEGMDMQAMVRDMRNRFWICLIFSLPIFLYSPMGMRFIALEPPFGMDLNLFLFFLSLSDCP